MTTTVVNIRTCLAGWQSDSDYVYIGRSGHGLPGTYGNDHKIGRCSICRVLHDREGAIEAFAIAARTKYASDPAYKALVEKLRGKYLVCFCVPQRCHGDVYVDMLHPAIPAQVAPAQVDPADSCSCKQQSNNGVWSRILNPHCPVHGVGPKLKVVS